MKRSKIIYPVLVLSVLVLSSSACLATDNPMQMIVRLVSPKATDASVGSSTEIHLETPTTNAHEPTSLPTIEPTVTEALGNDAQGTLMYRGNLTRTGVYQSPGPKVLPELAWQSQALGPILSSPAIADGYLYFGSDVGLHALDVWTGEELWTFETEARVSSSPAISNGSIYFGSHDGRFYSVAETTGQLDWTFNTGDRITSSPANFDGMVYFGSYDGFFYGLDAQTGAEVWKFDVAGIVDPDSGIQKGINSSPAVSEGVVLFGTTQVGGASAELYLYAVNSQTGEELWKYQAWNRVTSPAVLNGIVYFGGFGSIYGLDMEDGSLTFEFESGIVSTEPALHEEGAFFGTEDGLLFAVDLQTSEEIWSFNTGDIITSAPSVSGGVVYFGCSDGRLIALDIQTGQALWSYETGGRISTSPVIAAGVIYIGNDEGVLFALE